MRITQSLSEATVYATEGEAINAGENFCHCNPAEHARSNVDAAKTQSGGWVSVVTRENENFDRFIAA